MILMPEFYESKKICILGTGESLKKYSIEYDKYDLIVGINRIYKTTYFQYVNILYSCVSVKDWADFYTLYSNMREYVHLKGIVCCPFLKGANKKAMLEQADNKKRKDQYTLYCPEIVHEISRKKQHLYQSKQRELIVKSRPLTGIAALHHVCISGAKEVDLFGFDFYRESNKYIEGLRFYGTQSHSVSDNMKFFFLLKKKYKINWHK